MNRTFLNCLSAAACLALAAPSLAAQAAPKAVRVVRAQDPRPGVDIERRLTEVIELLDADELTPEQRHQARSNLQQLVEQMREQHARGAQTDRHDGKGGVVWRVAPSDRAERVEVMEIEGDPVIVEVDPQPTVRSRRLRIEGGPAAPRPPFDARDRQGRLDRQPGEPPVDRPRAPRAPKPPRAPARFEVEEGAPMAGGGGMVLRRLMERDDDDNDADAAHDQDNDAGDGDRRRVRRLRILREGMPDDAGAKVQHDVEVLLERRREAADARRAAARAQRAPAATLDDVTEEVELREMIEQMRAEMREVRALMERIRAQAPPGAPAPAPSSRGRLTGG